MATPKPNIGHLRASIADAGGIAHRAHLLRAGFPVTLLRTLVRDGQARLIRRAWLAIPDAPPDLATAALAGGRVSCVSLARRRGWWTPAATPQHLHLHLRPGAASAGLGETWPGVVHWTKPIAPMPAHALTASVEDAMGHIAICRPRDEALVLWESAMKVEGLVPEAVRTVRWSSRAARELAAAVSALSDSGLETLLVIPLRRAGLPVRQQVTLAGHRVDGLIGERLVVQVDGYEFHSGSAERTRDIAHDAELRLRGYTVLRFSYSQIVHDWPFVERTVHRAVAAGLHRAA